MQSPTSNGSEPTAAGGPARAAILGAAVTCGWVLHDLALFLPASPWATLELVPGWAAAVAVGALAGALLSGRPLVLVALLAGAAVASVLPRFVDLQVSAALRWLPRAGVILLLAFAASVWIQGRWRPGAWRTGLAAGAILCVAKTILRLGSTSTSWLVATAAVAALLLGFLPRPRLRQALTALVLLVPLGPVVRRAYHQLQPRPDLPPPSASARPGAPNLLLVVLDTLRADRLSCYGYGRATTPGIDAFVDEHATRYTQARSTSSWTLPSHASLLTGLLPGEHQATSVRNTKDRSNVLKLWPAQPMRDDVPTLAEILREAGYRTGAIVSNAFNVNARLGLDRGFEHFDDRRGGYVGDYLALAQLTNRRPWVGHRLYRSGDRITDLAIDWLGAREEGEPFFLFLNYMDCHLPYIPPPPYDAAFSDRRVRDPLAPHPDLLPLLYDRALLYLDVQVTRLLQAVEERGLLDSTVIIVTSDHGEALGEHGFPDHSWALYEAMIRVPLFVKPIGPRRVEVDPTPLNGADVFRLALQELEVEAPPVPEGPAVVAEWYRGTWYVPERLEHLEKQAGRDLDRDLLVWLEGSRKIIVSSKGDVEAYDIERDPDELEPLPLTPEEIDTALRRAVAWWEAHPPPATVDGEVDDDSLEELRALGY